MHVANACRYLFVGSSILLMYDNDNKAPHSRWARALEQGTRLHPDTYATLRRKTRVDVRMIDFAHTGPLPPGQHRDHGYITGIKTVMSALAHVMCALPRSDTPAVPHGRVLAACQSADNPWLQIAACRGQNLFRQVRVHAHMRDRGSCM